MEFLYVVSSGNAFDGISLTGPFETNEAAIEWASNNVDIEWSVVDVEKPVEGEYQPADLKVWEGAGLWTIDPTRLRAVATAANAGPWLDGGIIFEGDGAPGLSIHTGDGVGEGVAFVTDFCSSDKPSPKDYANQTHILAFDPPTALALLDRIADLEQRLHALADGARSKADVLASDSPTAKYYNPVGILHALANEAEKGLGGEHAQPD